MPDEVRAAGAVLWRATGDGIEVCVVHRPRYGDWSLPKGKLERGEHPLLAAAREVLEETGFRGRPQYRLPDVAYTLPSGVAKTVEFWVMRAEDAKPIPVADRTEVDAVRWLPPSAAGNVLTYPADAELVARMADLPAMTACVPVVRHASAGERKAWDGNDALRPLDESGRRQAGELATVLTMFAPQRLYAATPLRCKQTLEPLAQSLGLPIVSDSAFSEPDDLDELPVRARLAAGRLAELRDGEPVAICSQGKVMPPLLALLDGRKDASAYRTPKGGGWVLSWSGARLVALSRL